MHLALLLLLAFEEKYWERKPVQQWTDEQLLYMLSDSPWAQITTLRDGSPIPIYLASAKPVRAAEAEWMRRYTAQLQQKKIPVASDNSKLEYEAFLKENEGKVVVVGIRNPNLQALAQAEESKSMEEESFLKIGRKKIKMTGHFPPGESDPVLRLVFPRPPDTAKEITFELYIPGVTGPYRAATFRLKDMIFEGKTEM